MHTSKAFPWHLRPLRYRHQQLHELHVDVVVVLPGPVLLDETVLCEHIEVARGCLARHAQICLNIFDAGVGGRKRLFSSSWL